VDENSKYCLHCGSKIQKVSYCTACGTEASDNFKYCSKCGNPIKEELPFAEHAMATDTHSPPFKKTKSSKKTRKPIIIGSIIAAVLIIAATTLIMLNLTSGGQIRAHLMYLKDNEIYFTLISQLEPFQLSDNLIDSSNTHRAIDYPFHISVITGDQGRYMFFPSRIDSRGFATYYYKEVSGNNGKDIGERDPVRVDTDVDIFSVQLSQDGSKLFYLKGAERRLFVFDTKDNSSERIDSGVYQFYINDAGTYVLYGKDDDTIREIDLISGDNGRVDSDAYIQHVIDDASIFFYIKDESLFKKERGQDRERISSNISWSVSIIDSSNIFYVKSDEVMLNAMDYVNDDMQGDSRFDLLRRELNNTTIWLDSMDLYYYNGSEEIKVAENIHNILSMSEKNAVIAYTKYNNEDIIPINLSRINHVNDVERMIRSNRESSVGFYVAYTSLESEIIIDNAGGFVFNNSGTEMFYFDDFINERNHGVLTKIVFEAGGISSPIAVDYDVSSFRFGNGSDYVFYTKEIRNGVGDLYLDGTSIATDVELWSLYSFPDSQAIAYFKDYNTRNQNASLFLTKDGTTTKIADEVFSFAVEDDYHITYLVDYSIDRQRGDAFLFDGTSERKRVDTDVSAWIWKGHNIDTPFFVEHMYSAIPSVSMPAQPPPTAYADAPAPAPPAPAVSDNNQLSDTGWLASDHDWSQELYFNWDGTYIVYTYTNGEFIGSEGGNYHITNNEIHFYNVYVTGEFTQTHSEYFLPFQYVNEYSIIIDDTVFNNIAYW